MTSDTTAPPPALTYAGQLEQKARYLLPDLDIDGRMELLAVMEPDEMRASLAWLMAYAPQMFDFSLVRDEAMTRQLIDRLVEDLEPYCSACGGPIGIFHGHGEGWHHFTGEGTTESRIELYDAGHEPVSAWREAGK